MKDPKVSIIIACYNDPDVVVAVKSAYNQSYAYKEILVIDDGSSKETKDALATVEQYIDLLITQENKGQSNARNNGIKKADGEYILNWDSDDYFEPKFVKKAVQKMTEDGAVKIVTCKARRFNSRETIDVFTPRGGSLENFLFRNSAMGSSMFKKADWEACGGYEEDLPILGFEDWEFYIQILKSGGYAFVIPEVLFHYQVRPDSTTARIKNLKQDKYKHIIFKHSEIYKKNFDGLVENLFMRLNKSENEKMRLENSVNCRLGKFILKPLRSIKYSVMQKKSQLK